MEYFIVEHPTRGVLREIEFEGGKFIPRFSATGSRSDPEKSRRFVSVPLAQREIGRVLWKRGMVELRVRRSSDWKALCPACERWCDQPWEHGDLCPVRVLWVRSHER